MKFTFSLFLSILLIVGANNTLSFAQCPGANTPDCTTGNPYHGVVINEISADGGNIEARNDAIVELAGLPGTNIGCMVITNGEWAVVLPSATVIPADGVFIIGCGATSLPAANANDDSAYEPVSGLNCSVCDFEGMPLDFDVCDAANSNFVSPSIGTYGFTLDNGYCGTNNDGDQVILFQPDGTPHDAVYWGLPGATPSGINTFGGSNGACGGGADHISVQDGAAYTLGDNDENGIINDYVGTHVGRKADGGDATAVNFMPAGDCNANTVCYTMPGLDQPIWIGLQEAPTGCNSSFVRLLNTDGSHGVGVSAQNPSHHDDPDCDDIALPGAPLVPSSCNAANALAQWGYTDHPTPGNPNNADVWDLNITCAAGAPVAFANSCSGEITYFVCQPSAITFQYNIFNYQHVSGEGGTTLTGEVGHQDGAGTGNIGSYIDVPISAGGAGLTPWTYSTNGAGTTSLTHTTPVIPVGTHTITLQWKDYIYDCCGSNNPASNNECYERVTVKIIVAEPLAVASSSLNCPPLTAGVIDVGTAAGVTGGCTPTYQLFDNGAPVGSTNTTGLFSLPNSLTGPITVQVSSGCPSTTDCGPATCNNTQTISINNACRAAPPPCPTISWDATSTIEGTKCPGDQLQLCINGTNLPCGGSIEFYNGNNSSFDPYAGQGTLIGSETITCTSGPCIPDLYISSFVYDVITVPAGCSDGTWGSNSSEVIELVGTPGCSIGCWRISDGEGTITIPAGTLMPVDGVFVIGGGCSSIPNLDLNTAGCGCLSGSFALANGGDQIMVVSNTGVVIDALAYEGAPTSGQSVIASAAQVGCSAASSVPVPSASFETGGNLGTSFEGTRIENATDNNWINSSTDFDGIGTTNGPGAGSGTPGTSTPVLPVCFNYTIPSISCNNTTDDFFKAVIKPRQTAPTECTGTTPVATPSRNYTVTCPVADLQAVNIDACEVDGTQNVPVNLSNLISGQNYCIGYTRNGVAQNIQFNATGTTGILNIPIAAPTCDGTQTIILTSMQQDNTCPAAAPFTGCAGTVNNAEATVNIHPTITATLTAATDITGCTPGTGDDGSVTVDFSSVNCPIGVSGPWTFVYEVNGTQTELTTNNDPYTFTTDIAGTYSLISVVDEASCAGNVSPATRTVDPPASAPTVISVGTIPNVCNQAPVDAIDLTAVAITVTPAGGTFTWYTFNPNDPAFDPNAFLIADPTNVVPPTDPNGPLTTTYYFIYELANGCTAVGSVAVTTTPDVCCSPDAGVLTETSQCIQFCSNDTGIIGSTDIVVDLTGITNPAIPADYTYAILITNASGLIVYTQTVIVGGNAPASVVVTPPANLIPGTYTIRGYHFKTADPILPSLASLTGTNISALIALLDFVDSNDAAGTGNGCGDITNSGTNTVPFTVLAPIVITAQATCAGSPSSLPLNPLSSSQYQIEVTNITGGIAPYTVTLDINGDGDVADANETQTFTGTALIFGLINHTGTGTGIKTVNATDSRATTDTDCPTACTASKQIIETLCPEIGDGCDCTVQPPYNAGYLLRQAESGTFTAFGATGFTQVYLLVDQTTGLIIASNNTGYFDGLVNGTYNVYALNYDNDDPNVSALLNAIQNGDPISSVAPFNPALNCCYNISLPSTVVINCNCCQANADVLSPAPQDICSGGTWITINVPAGAPAAPNYGYLFLLTNGGSNVIIASSSTFAGLNVPTTNNGTIPVVFNVYGLSYNMAQGLQPIINNLTNLTNITDNEGDVIDTNPNPDACMDITNAPAVLTIHPPATVNAGPDLTVCQSVPPTAITLSGATVGGGATQAQWTHNGTGTLSVTTLTSTPATVTYTPGAGETGTITLTLTSQDPTGPCTAVSDTRTITITPIPTTPTANDVVVCEGELQTITITSVAGATYTFYAGNAITVLQSGTNNNFTPVPPASPNTMTNYFVSVTVNGCTSVLDPVSLTVIQNPAAPTVSNITVCEGGSTLITPAPCGTETASFSSAVYNFNASNTVATVTGNGATANNGTAGSGVSNLNFFTGNPGLAWSADNWTAATSPDVNDYFEFCISPTNDCFDLNLTSFSFDFRRSNTGPQTWVVQYSTDGFATFTTIGTATGYAANTFVASGSLAVNKALPFGTGCFRIYAYASTGTAGTFRIDNVNIAGSSTNTQYNFYSNSGLTSLLAGPVSSYNPNTTPATSPQNIWVTAIDANGCESAASQVTVVVNPAPTATATPATQTLCSGSNTNILLTSPQSGTNFIWTVSGATGNVVGETACPSGCSNLIAQTLSLAAGITTPQTITYTVTPIGVAPTNCPGTPIAVDITVNPNPDVTATPSATIICSGSTTDIALSSTIAGTLYTWTATGSSGTVTGFSNQATPVAGPIAQTLTNTGNNAATVTYTIMPLFTNGGITCTGAPTIVVITVNPTPTATATPTVNLLCSGDATSIAINSPQAGTIFTWTVSGATGNVVGESACASNCGNLITQTLSLAVGITTPQTITYTITPVGPAPSNCAGTPINVDVTINPVPDATATPVNSSVCSGVATNIALSSSVAGTLFTWTASGSNGNLSGFSNQITPVAGPISQVLTNSGTSSATVTYVITPVFTNGAATCTGTPVTAVVTVNPIPVVTATPNTQAICSGGSTSVALTSNVPGTSFSWTVTDNPNVTGEANGSGSSITQTLSLAAGVTTPQVVTYTVTPTANGCAGSNTTVTITVNPNPVAPTITTTNANCGENNGSADFTIPAGMTVAYSEGTVFDVINAVPVTTTPVTGLTPGNYVFRFTSNSTSCFTDVVILIGLDELVPLPDVPTPQAVCFGQPNIALVSGGGTNYQWYGPNNINLLISGATGSSYTPIVTVPGVYNYYVSNTVNGCESPRFGTTYTIWALPAGSAQPASQTICSSTFTTIELLTDIPGSNFTWTVPANNNGATSCTSECGNVINQQLTNTTNSPVTITYTVTPLSVNGCLGNSFPVNITINPLPVVIPNPTSMVLCSGQTTNIGLNSNVTGSLFTWVAVPSSGSVSGYSNQNTPVAGPILQTLTSTSNQPVTVTYIVTAYGPEPTNCQGPTTQVVVTVIPVYTMQPISNPAPVCSDGDFDVTVQTNGSVRFVYNKNGGILTDPFNDTDPNYAILGEAVSDGNTAVLNDANLPANTSCGIITYTVYAINVPIATDPNCRTMRSFEVKTYPEITATTISGTCTQPASINVNCAAELGVTPANITWLITAGPNTGLTGTGNTYTPDPGEAGSIQYTVTAGLAGMPADCKTAVFNTGFYCPATCPTIVAPVATANNICSGGNIGLSVTVNNPDGGTLTWYNQLNQPIPNPNNIVLTTTDCQGESFSFYAVYDPTTAVCSNVFSQLVTVWVYPDITATVSGNNTCQVSLSNICPNYTVTWAADTNNDGIADQNGTGATYQPTDGSTGKAIFTVVHNNANVPVACKQKTFEVDFTAPNAGTVTSVAPQVICADNLPQTITVNTNGGPNGYKYDFVLVDGLGNILQTKNAPAKTAQFTINNPGDYCIYGISYLDVYTTSTNIVGIKGQCVDVSNTCFSVDALEDLVASQLSYSCIDGGGVVAAFTLSGGKQPYKPGNFINTGKGTLDLTDLPVVQIEGLFEGDNVGVTIVDDNSCTTSISGLVPKNFCLCPSFESVQASTTNICSDDDTFSLLASIKNDDGGVVTWFDENNNIVTNPNNITATTNECNGEKLSYYAVYAPKSGNCQAVVSKLVNVTVHPKPNVFAQLIEDADNCTVTLLACPQFDVSYTVNGGPAQSGNTFSANGQAVNATIAFTISDGLYGCGSFSNGLTTILDCEGVDACPSLVYTNDSDGIFDICNETAATLAVAVLNGSTADIIWRDGQGNIIATGVSVINTDLLTNTTSCNPVVYNYTAELTENPDDNCPAVSLPFVVKVYPDISAPAITNTSANGCTVSINTCSSFLISYPGDGGQVFTGSANVEVNADSPNPLPFTIVNPDAPAGCNLGQTVTVSFNCPVGGDDCPVISLPVGNNGLVNVCTGDDLSLSVLYNHVEPNEILWFDLNNILVGQGANLDLTDIANTTCDKLTLTYKALVPAGKGGDGCPQTSVIYTVKVRPDVTNPSHTNTTVDGCLVTVTTCPSFTIDYDQNPGTPLFGTATIDATGFGTPLTIDIKYPGSGSCPAATILTIPLPDCDGGNQNCPSVQLPNGAADTYTVCSGDALDLTVEVINANPQAVIWSTGQSGLSINTGILTNNTCNTQVVTFTAVIAGDADCPAEQITIAINILPDPAGVAQVTVDADGCGAIATACPNTIISYSVDGGAIITGNSYTINAPEGQTITQNVTFYFASGETCNKTSIAKTLTCVGLAKECLLNYPDDVLPNITICSGESADLSVLPTNVLPNDILWSNGATGVNITTGNLTNNTCTPIVNVYTAKVQAPAQCSDVELSYFITVLPDPATTSKLTVNTDDCGLSVTTCPDAAVSYSVNGGTAISGNSYTATPPAGTTENSEVVFTVTTSCGSSTLTGTISCEGEPDICQGVDIVINSERNCANAVKTGVYTVDNVVSGGAAPYQVSVTDKNNAVVLEIATLNDNTPFTFELGNTNGYKITVRDQNQCIQVLNQLDIEPCYILPIELLSFYGEVLAQGNELTWNTASEIDNAWFTVMHSVDGVNFEPIAKLKAAGNSSTPHDYQYLHPNTAAGINYYYLTTTTALGETVKASGIISLVRGTLNFEILSVAPVPAKETVELKFISPEANEITGLLMDITGRAVKQWRMQANIGLNATVLDMRELAAGVYFVSLSNNKAGLMTKFVKQD